jgi:hypothetical protein
MTWVGDSIAWELTDHGATYWILAPSSLMAMELWIKCIHEQGMQDEDFDGVGLTSPDRESLDKMRFHGEGAGHPHRGYECSMLEEMECDPSPRVVACSEWP